MGCYKLSYYSFTSTEIALKREGLEADFEKNCANSYRYGFNGKEKDIEGMGGGGSTYDYGFRIYNPQIARFLSTDPLTAGFPWYTPYQYAGNKPIWAIDLDGLEDVVTTEPPVPEDECGDGSQGGEILEGTIKVAAGVITTSIAIVWSVGTEGVGAALGGAAAINLGASTFALGLVQISNSGCPVDAVSNSSNVIGYGAYNNGVSNPQLYDALGGLIPNVVTGGGSSFTNLVNAADKFTQSKNSLEALKTGYNLYDEANAILGSGLAVAEAAEVDMNYSAGTAANGQDESKPAIAVVDETAVAKVYIKNSLQMKAPSGSTTSSMNLMEMIKQNEAARVEVQMKKDYEALKFRHSIGGLVPYIFKNYDGSLISYEQFKMLN